MTRDDWLLEAALRSRHDEQTDSPWREPDMYRDPWQIQGPPTCIRCGHRLARDSKAVLCDPCDQRVFKACAIPGCKRRAVEFGRCKRHHAGDPDFLSWSSTRNR